MPLQQPTPTSTPTFNKPDAFAAVIAAIDEIICALRRIPKHTKSGRGTIDCPRCREPLAYAWSRTAHGKTNLQGKCATPECVVFLS
jgi:hypothetical protein